MRRALAVLAGLVLWVTSAFGAPGVQARLSAGEIDVGSTTVLVLTVTNPSGSVGDPKWDVPAGLEVLASSRGQSFQWINGQSTNALEFRYDLGAQAPGRYAIGPIAIAVGGQTFVSGTLSLVVTAGARARSSAGGGGRGAASLLVDVTPRDPYVGQLVRLSARLVQRVQMADESQYVPPATPGFWTEGWSDPVAYQATENGRGVIVIERQQRLYPLAAGRAVVGPATALVLPLSGGFGSLFGGDRPVQLESDSIPIRVRALPEGAPSGFDGAVGQFQTTWSADRESTAIDLPITVRFDVRGLGNLPLVRSPKLVGSDFEVFASLVEDSLPRSGQIAAGRRRFQWTVLPRHGGRIQLPAPDFAWFDPEAGVYRSASSGRLSIRVGPPLAAISSTSEGFPTELSKRPASPGATAGWPWAFALAGLLGGLGIARWRQRGEDPALSIERARQREWLRAVGLARGPDFWKAADEAVSWVEGRGGKVLRLREDIASARYGGAMAPEDDVRRRLVERLGESLPPPAPQGRGRLIGGALLALALAALVLGWPRGGPDRWQARTRAADASARAGHLKEAVAEWERLWNEAPGHGPLAARLAWASLELGELPRASLWALRGDLMDARDPAVGWVTERVRESGGLVGARTRAVPIRAVEWGILACACALLGTLEWRRRRVAWPALGVALVAVVWPVAEHQWERMTPQAVARVGVAVDGAGVDLVGGQVVQLVGVPREGKRRVRAGAGVQGEVRADALLPVEELR